MVNEAEPSSGQGGTAGGASMEGRFSGRLAFQQGVRDALAMAHAENWREIIFCDLDFADWPLAERAVAEALQQWSATGRKFTMLARSYEPLIRTQHRFVQWRRQWAHIIECRGCRSAEPSDFPSGIWSPAWALDRRDPVRSVGVMGRDPVMRVAQRERLTEWLQKSTQAFTASTLGL